jgi:hypothetical protein
MSVIRCIKLEPLKVLPSDFPVVKNIPNHDMKRDLNLFPPTYVEALYSLVIEDSLQGQNLAEALEARGIAGKIIILEADNESELAIEEPLYKRHIESKLVAMRFSSWTDSMIEFATGIKNSQTVVTRHD